jgi:hypothetical protein
MIETTIILMGLIAPSFLLGYSVKWMIDEERIKEEILLNKQLNKQNKKLLEEINY